MAALLEEVEQQLALARAGGGPRSIERHRGRGKLLTRERIELLLDQDSPFLELSPLAGWGTDFTVGGGMVTGIGVVSGVECVINGHDPTVMGGAITALSNKKLDRSLEISRLNRLPYIQFVESAGGDLRRGTGDPDAEMRRNLTHFAESGGLFHDITVLSGSRIPTVSVVFGSSTAGGAYQPGMSDYNIFIRERSKVFLAGPPLVKMATGEDSDDETLGGAQLHAERSGLADYLAEDEVDALRMCREVVSHLNWRKRGEPPRFAVEEPRCDPEELLGLLSPDLKSPVDVREVIARVVDGSRFEEFKPRYGASMVCGWSSIHGHPVGLLGNNGVIYPESAEKAAHFIQLANQIDVPLVFLQNITGFMVGREYEAGGIAKHGAKMVNAVACTRVPKLTVVIGGSYGAGNYSMCGRAFSPRFLWMWPNARISVMGGEQAASVLATVRRDQLESREETWSSAEEEAFKEPIRAQYEHQGHPTYSTARLWDDGIIDPIDTRRTLALALDVAGRAPMPEISYGVFRM